MNTEMYRQCRLARTIPTGRVETTSYIPASYARVGNVLGLKGPDGTWTMNWEVLVVGPLVEEPPDWRKLVRGHRKMTGDSLPRGE